MSIEQKLKWIKYRYAEINALRELIAKEEQLIAEHECPFEIGDVIEVGCKSGAVGAVELIQYKDYGCLYSVKIRKFDENGVKSKSLTRVFHPENYKLKEAE